MSRWRIPACSGFALILLAAPLRAQNPIPNPGFESWSGGQPVGWTTTNSGFPPEPFTQTSDKHSGSSALKGEIIEIQPGTFLPCILNAGPNYQGFATTVRWAEVDGFYKLNPVIGDQIQISVFLMKGGSQGTVVGLGSAIISQPTSTYLSFSVPINYDLPYQPDSALISIGVVPSVGIDAHAGTTFQLDDLSMSGNVAAVCPITVLGDVNVTGDRSVSDIVYLIGYVLKGGTQPHPCVAAGDVNCDGAVSTSDIIYLVNNILKAGPAPCNVCTMISAGTWACNPGGGGTDTLATTTDSARYISLMAIDSVAHLNDGVTPESLATALLAFVSSRPEYAATGQQGTSVWARFTDGRMVMIPNNRFPEPGPVQTPHFEFSLPEPPPPMPVQPLPPRKVRSNESSSLAETQRQVPTTTCGLPHSCKAGIFGALGGNCFRQGQWYIENALFYSGYADYNFSPTVNGLASVDSFGVFYIDAHGGVCESENNVSITGIWTTTPYSVANDATFRSQLDADELVYMYAKGDSANTCANQWRYAFTGKFVSSYMSFTPNSFVYIGACYSDAPSLRAGFKTAGASVFTGWTMPVTDPATNKASEFLFDRMTGHNDSRLTPKESPKQRPFDLANVHQDLISRGLDYDLSSGSELRITELNSGFGILDPSIRYAYVVPFTDTLFLTGLFGENPGARGHVFVDGQEQTIYDWQPTFIWTSIPRSGPGWAGTMIVQVDPKIGTAHSPCRSNKVNLTGWTGQFTYTKQEQGSLLGTVIMDVSFRADVHPFRETPHTTPHRNPLNYFGGDLSSKAFGSTVGQYQYVVPGDPPEVLTWSWDGSTPYFFVPPTGATSVDPWGEFLLQGNVEGATDSLNLFLFVTAGGASTTMETLVSSKHGAYPPTDVVLSPPTFLYDSPPATLRLGFTNGFVIEGGPRLYYECCSSYPNDFSPPDIVHKLDWNAMAPFAAPDPNEAQ